MTVCAGCTCVVTGGSRGIGLAIARALADAGAAVAIGDIDAEAAAAAAAELGRGAVGLELDVADPDTWERFAEEVEARLGPVDLLVSNAGVMAIGRFSEEPAERALRQVAINLDGVILGIKRMLPGMLSRGRGHVVNVASAAGKTAYPGGATYCASKHGVVGLSEALRDELRGTGVGITVVLPGVVATELTSGLRTPRGVRAVSPEDVADATVAAIERDRFSVYVPRTIGVATKAMLAMPRPLADRVRALAGAGSFLVDVDVDGRAGYEGRIGSS
ncbi:MAG: SDR family NAD(P)-dependent oxidoreductase [Solirubrobacterales bacterium]|nr:SDR family NAD(P)-dependent oxidoreductase [Solirubrobacterales bacterium]MCO5326179.1 SDR family NAD(P)-dependent oxidoreductase [Solirubrobacterales bacterium]